METSKTLIHPLILGLLHDVCVLYPDSSFQYEQDFIENELFLYPEETIVLEMSRVGKALETALITGNSLCLGDLPLFPLDDGSALPRFFSILWEDLFFRSGRPRWVGESLDSPIPIVYPDESGEPVNQLRALSLMCLRQFFLCFSKLGSVECLVDSDIEIDAFKNRLTSVPEVTCESSVLSCARVLLTQLFVDNGELCAPLAQFALDPFGQHGPGAVSDGSKGRDKWLFNIMSGLPENLFKTQHNFLKQSGYVGEPTSKLAIVPKDFRGHRLICVEPKEFMFYQQGLMRVVYELVHSHLPTSLCVDFKNQFKSFRLSRKRGNATIDLKDASDLVSLRLARLLFPKEVLKLATVARSRGVALPDETVENYSTLFTMGNALCFPFETLVFWSLSLATMLYEEHLTHLASSSPFVVAFLKRHPLRVFGDDIVVPKRYYKSLCVTLSRCGLSVNTAKSCCDTPVREACGSWYYNGIDCRIVRLKTHYARKESDWISLMESARLLHEEGFLCSSETILSYLDLFIPVPYGIGWLPGKVQLGRGNMRYNFQLQRLEVRIPQLKGARADLLTGETGLYSYFTGKGSHMAPRHDAERVEWGWVDRI